MQQAAAKADKIDVAKLQKLLADDDSDEEDDEQATTSAST